MSSTLLKCSHLPHKSNHFHIGQCYCGSSLALDPYIEIWCLEVGGHGSCPTHDMKKSTSFDAFALHH
jgi:hypothetical protein